MKKRLLHQPVKSGTQAIVCSPIKFLFVMLFMLSVSTITHADVFEDGLSAFGGAKYDQAFTIWKPLAEKGNAAAQYYMGVMYANGQGVKKDFIKAYAWYTVAAEEQDMAEENRDDITQEMTVVQLEQAKALAQEYTSKFIAH